MAKTQTDEAPKRTRKVWTPSSTAHGALVDACAELVRQAKVPNIVGMKKAMGEVTTAYIALRDEIMAD